MRFFWRAIHWIVEMLKIIGAACLAGMTFLTCVDVVGRFFQHPIFGSVEIVAFMATLTVAMAMPYTHYLKAHIGVEIVVRQFSPKTQRIVDFFTGILSLGLFGIVTWRMACYALDIQRSGEVSMNLELPIHAIIYVVSFCFLIFALVILQDVVQNIMKLREEK